MSRTSALLELMPLLNRFKDGFNLENLILKPHLDIDEWIGQVLRQIVKVFSQVSILRVLEQKLLLRQLTLLW